MVAKKSQGITFWHGADCQEFQGDNNQGDLKGSGLHQKPGFLDPVSTLLHCCVPVSLFSTASCLICPCLTHLLLTAFSRALLSVEVIFVVPAALQELGCVMWPLLKYLIASASAFGSRTAKFASYSLHLIATFSKLSSLPLPHPKHKCLFKMHSISSLSV